jgi:hypothetical protein
VLLRDHDRGPRDEIEDEQREKDEDDERTRHEFLLCLIRPAARS